MTVSALTKVIHRAMGPEDQNQSKRMRKAPQKTWHLSSFRRWTEEESRRGIPYGGQVITLQNYK